VDRSPHFYRTSYSTNSTESGTAQHRFVRYADDCNIYVRSRRRTAGDDERHALPHAPAQLKVNEAKSAVARPVERKFLGLASAITESQTANLAEALLRCKQRIRELTRRTRGISLEQMLKELRPT